MSVAANTSALADKRPVPRPRFDNLTRWYGNEAVVWATEATEPAFLDPVAALILQIVDGQATQSDLVEDVIDVLGIDADVAGYQVSRSTETFRRSGLLEGTGALEPPPTDLDLFRDPPST